eukprot:g21160.t1
MVALSNPVAWRLARELSHPGGEGGTPQRPHVVFSILGESLGDWNRQIRNEWNEVARRLAAASFHVLVPDFHSAPSPLRPGRLSGEVVRELFPTLCTRNHMIPSRYKSVIRLLCSVLGS